MITKFLPQSYSWSQLEVSSCQPSWSSERSSWARPANTNPWNIPEQTRHYSLSVNIWRQKLSFSLWSHYTVITWQKMQAPFLLPSIVEAFMMSSISGTSAIFSCSAIVKNVRPGQRVTDKVWGQQDGLVISSSVGMSDVWESFILYNSE